VLNRKAAKGFTLLEVLIALSVLAIALGAIIQSVAATTNNVGYLRDRTLAHWVAMNKVTELQVGTNDWPALGNTDGTYELANYEWYWKVSVVEAGLKDIRRLEVEVRRDRDGKQALSSLIALVGKPGS